MERHGFAREWQLSCRDEYYTDRTATSSTALRVYSNSGPMAYWHYYLSGELPEPRESVALTMGSLFHKLMEGVDINGLFVCEPEDINGFLVNKRVKKHREYLAEWAAEQQAAGKVIVKAGAADSFAGMARSLKANDTARKLMAAGGRTEHPIRWTDPGSGLLCKALADLWQPESNVLVDFKTTRHYSTAAFARDAKAKGYHQQAAHYCDGFDTDEFIIVSVRNEKPWECMTYRLTDKFIQAGRELNRLALDGIRDCKMLGSWQSDGHGELIDLEA